MSDNNGGNGGWLTHNKTAFQLIEQHFLQKSGSGYTKHNDPLGTWLWKSPDGVLSQGTFTLCDNLELWKRVMVGDVIAKKLRLYHSKELLAAEALEHLPAVPDEESDDDTTEEAEAAGDDVKMADSGEDATGGGLQGEAWDGGEEKKDQDGAGTGGGGGAWGQEEAAA